jgi:hypothetical protein
MSGYGEWPDYVALKSSWKPSGKRWDILILLGIQKASPMA